MTMIAVTSAHPFLALFVSFCLGVISGFLFCSCLVVQENHDDYYGEEG